MSGHYPLAGIGLVLLIATCSGCGSSDNQAKLEQAELARQRAVARAESQAAKPLDRDQEIEESEQLLEQGEFAAAIAKLQALLLVDPEDAEVIFRLASVVAQQGDLAGGLQFLDSIPVDHPEAGIPALGQSADWCMQLKRYDEAERRYREVLEIYPQSPEVHRQLAYLFNRQGRRHEAAVHVRELCRQGNVRQDELHSLIHVSYAMYDDPSRDPETADDVVYWPIGVSAEARKLFMEEKYQEAVNRLHPSVAAGDEPASIVALFGRAAAEAQDDKQFNWWLTQVDDLTKGFSEYWAAIGLHLLLQNRHAEATRALLEAVDRDPTDYRSLGRLRSAMEALGKTEEAARWDERSMLMRRIFFENNRIADATTPAVESMENLAEMLDSIDRSLEAVLWRSMAGYHQQLPPETMAKFSERLQQTVRDGQGFPDRAARLCNVDLDEFPMPQIEADSGLDLAQPSGDIADNPSPPPARFDNVAAGVGLQHAYQVSDAKLDHGFSVYQSVGGAVAVIDYDLDGKVDLYFAQGAAAPPEFIAAESNVLYRHSDGKLIDVTQSAAAAEYRYSLGVTAGDWNQDGFADLVVGNIGANLLLINNGDGTFTRTTLDDDDDKTLMTTSLAMGDLSGDALPDIFALSYLHDPEIVKRPKTNERGEVIDSLKPLDFRPGLDRLIINDGRGKPISREMGEFQSAARAGLGLVVGDFDDQPGNEVFVGNDVYANQLWIRGDNGQWSDAAMLQGCAYGFNGAKTASMGIASGDFDRNGWLDFHVTNFQEESVSFYLNDRGSYQDRNVQFGLAVPSKAVLGFGSQAIDYDNDSKLDLVVTNGHIEKAIGIQAPFEQPAQLFRNRGRQFENVAVTDPSGYWDKKHLGRGLARLDFDRDGRMDCVITHLGEESALLVNRTQTENHWLQLVLVGVASERDAIGAQVQIRFDGQQSSEWLVAGDGYFARNEAVLAFGLGEVESVDEISIRWPSGKVQTIDGVAADRRWMIIEDETEPFEM